MKQSILRGLFFVFTVSAAAACGPDITVPPAVHEAYVPLSEAHPEVRDGFARARLAGASIAVVRLDAVRPEPGGHRAELSASEIVLLPTGVEVDATVLAGESAAEGTVLHFRLPGPTTCGPLESEPEVHVCVDYAFPTPTLREGESWQVAFREQHGVNTGFHNMMGGRSIPARADPAQALVELGNYVDQSP